MATKPILVSTIVAALFMAVGFRFLSRREISFNSSPGGRYTVQIMQERPFPGYERYVYLNVSRSGESFLQGKLLYTGDMLDSEFKELYPNYSWSSESILKIGDVEGGQINALRISNETSRGLKYLLIETYRDKYVLFDVEASAVIDLHFSYSGRLSCQGQFRESDARFGDAVELGNGDANVEGSQFIICVRENAMRIGSQLGLRHVTCCAADRPDFYHE
jgi:hypothetical protein